MGVTLNKGPATQLLGEAEGQTPEVDDSQRALQIAARLDRLPSSPYLWRLVVLLSLGAFFEVYDLLMTGYVSPGLIRAGVFSEEHGSLLGLSDQATFASVTFAGLLLGTLLFGSVADRLGRRKVFTFALLWYALATAVMAAQSSASGIFLFRFIAGLGVGIEMVTIDTFIAELVPRQFRGRAFAVNQGLMFLSVPTVAFLSWSLTPLAPLGIAGWRWVVGFPVLAALFVWWIQQQLPESPRWLAQHGRATEADRIVTAMEVRIAREVGRQLEPPATAETAPPQRQDSTWAELFRPPYRQRTIVLSVFNFFQTIGFYGFGNWVPKLVSGQGVNVADSLLYSAMIAVAFPVGPFIFTLFADRFERKWQIVVAALGTAVFGVLFTLQRTAWAIVAFGVLITMSNNMMSYSFHTYQAEVFPTRFRARGVGFVYSFSRLSTIFTSFLIAFFSKRFGNPGAFAFISVSMLIAAFAVGRFGPPTRGRRLEEIGR
jgi:MFS transporter, putative metabolite:H+ symporter